VFTVEVSVQGQALASGTGLNKQEAERAAARQALESLEAESAAAAVNAPARGAG
jgi:dsRNA-specific ribonuclease